MLDSFCKSVATENSFAISSVISCQESGVWLSRCNDGLFDSVPPGDRTMQRPGDIGFTAYPSAPPMNRTQTNVVQARVPVRGGDVTDSENVRQAACRAENGDRRGLFRERRA